MELVAPIASALESKQSHDFYGSARRRLINQHFGKAPIDVRGMNASEAKAKTNIQGTGTGEVDSK